MRDIPATAAFPAQPRAEGHLTLTTKDVGGRSAIDRFRTSGSFKALFPRRQAGVEAIVLNTGGGITGGDRFDIMAGVGAGTHLTLTTQAAERAYRAAQGWGEVQSTISVAARATLHWLPQELILFNGCALSRRLHIDLAAEARALVVEPVIFGRTAMGETLTEAAFRDMIHIDRAGRPIYRDATRMTGDLAARMRRAAIGQGAGAMVSLIYAAPDAPAHLDAVRAHLPDTGGASLLADDLLVLRLVASGAHELRQSLLPILDRLSGNSLPVSWRL